MYRFFSSLVLAAVLLLMTTYGGMAVFGMGVGMQVEHGHDPCVGASCHAEPSAGTSGMDCVEHCLSLIPVAASAVPLSSVVMLGVALLVLAMVSEAAVVDRLRGLQQRWREGIRKCILKETLATVILRN